MADQLDFNNMIGGNSAQVDEQMEAELAAEPMSLSSMLSTYTTTPAFDSSDMIIPRLRLCQGLTKEVQEGSAKPGNWLVSGFDPAAELTIVPIAMARRRELLSEDMRRLCVASSATVGEGDPGGDCSKCPKNKWVPNPRDPKKNLPPECNFVYSYMVWIAEYDSTALLEFKRTAVNVGKAINTILARTGFGKCAIRLSSVASAGKKGAYFVPVATRISNPQSILELAKNSL